MRKFYQAGSMFVALMVGPAEELKVHSFHQRPCLFRTELMLKCNLNMFDAAVFYFSYSSFDRFSQCGSSRIAVWLLTKVGLPLSLWPPFTHPSAPQLQQVSDMGTATWARRALRCAHPSAGHSIARLAGPSSNSRCAGAMALLSSDRMRMRPPLSMRRSPNHGRTVRNTATGAVSSALPFRIAAGASKRP